MFEKVNPSHPDKVADRIAGALVDMAYRKDDNPRIAVEVLIGHGRCSIIAETSVTMLDRAGLFTPVADAVHRIAGDSVSVDYREWPQDAHLAENQTDGIRCGDNGIFRGCPVTDEQRWLSQLMRGLYGRYPYDGKAVLDCGKLTLCQSNVDWDEDGAFIYGLDGVTVNPLGYWTGGTDVDTGATNRKLGSDMGDAVTGGGLHGKDLSKADVSVNIVCHKAAQDNRTTFTASCAIGDGYVDFFGGEGKSYRKPYSEVVECARDYVDELGGFEKLAEWGLI